MVLAISKAADQDSVAPGAQLTYTITYTNLGTQMATGVVVTETYDANVSFVSANPPPDADTDNRWTIGNLIPNQTFHIVVVTRVSPSAIAGDAVRNDVDITCPIASAQATQTSIVSGPPVPASRRQLTTSGKPRNPRVGTNPIITWPITARNTNPAAVDTVVTDVIPDPLTYLSANPPPTSVSGSTVTWSFPGLAPGLSRKITLLTSLPPSTAPGAMLVNTATMTDSLGHIYKASCILTVRAPGLGIKIAAPRNVRAGGQAMYKFSVENTGVNEAQGVSMTATLPVGLAFVKALPAPVAVTGREITWNLPSFPAPGKARISVLLAVSPSAASGTVLATSAFARDAIGNVASTTMIVRVR